MWRLSTFTADFIYKEKHLDYSNCSFFKMHFIFRMTLRFSSKALPCRIPTWLIFQSLGLSCRYDKWRIRKDTTLLRSNGWQIRISSVQTDPLLRYSLSHPSHNTSMERGRPSEPECLLSCSQEPSTVPYPEPDESIQHSHTLYLQNLFQF
jgi:hypothetical protein